MHENETMNDKLIAILKFLVLISLLILFLSSSFTNKNNCGTCEFELEGKSINAGQFINEYFEVCINPFVKRNNLENFSGLVIE